MNKYQYISMQEYCTNVTDGTHATPKEAQYGYPLVTSKNLNNGRLDLNNTYLISEYDYNEINARSKVDKNDVLISMIGTVGLVCFVDRQPDFAIKNVGLLKNKDEFHGKWLYYYLSSPEGQYSIQERLRGTTQQYIPLNEIRKLPVKVLFSTDDMKKIVNFLSYLDDKIELNAQINHNLEEQLYALYASNYDNLSGKKVPLKECCSFQEGYVNPTQTKPEYFDGSVKWLRAVDINESFIISTSRTLTEQGFASAGKSALLFPKDSIAISKSGTIGRLGIVADNMCGNRAVINIVPKQKKWLAFIYCYLKSRQAEFSDLAVGSVQKNLYVSILEPLEIFSPADRVLNDFHFSAQTILEKMKNNCFEMQSLAQLRDALLPKLMSGEIDVSEVEI
jgi:type I restriction enzyme S subunit